MTILIVDDKPPGRYFKTKVLQRQGYEVLEAVNGQQALSLSAAVQPHVVVLDIVLPDISGLEVARQIKSNPTTKDIMVLQTSAIRVNMEDRATGIECGADAYLIEPLQEEEFVGTVRALSRLAVQLRENRSLLGKLMRTENQLLDATEAAQCGIWDWNIQTNELEWFGTHERLAGMQPGSFSGKVEAFFELLHPDDRGRVREKINQLIARHEIRYVDEYRFVHPDGTIHWMGANGRFYYADNQAVRMTGVVQDITARKQAEEHLQESEAEFRAMFTLSSVGKAQADASSGRLLRVNSALCAITGYSETELLARTIGDITHPDDRERDGAMFARMVSGHASSYECDKRYLRPDGTVVWAHVAANVIRSVAGRPLRVAAVIQDITARKEAEKKLQQVAASLALAQRVSRAGIWDWDIGANKPPYISPEYRELYGLPVEEPMSYEKWLGLVHPEDRARIAKYGEECFAGNSTDYNVEFRIQHPQLGERWLVGLGRVERNAAGEPVRFTGINLDITDRKRMEMALAHSEEQLRFFIHNTPAAIAMFDRDMRYIAASRRWYTDYRLNELTIIGRSHYEVFPEIPARWREIHQRCLMGAIETADDDRFDRLDGSQQRLRWEVRPWKMANGDIGGILMLTEDITERRRAEEALRTSRAELANELADTRLLERISTELIHEERVELLYEKIIDAAVAIMRSDYATMQRFYSERGPEGELRILVFRGFDAVAALGWEWVSPDAPTTCAAALRSNQRVIVPDFEQCPFMAGTAALAAHLKAGVRAAQSTPLISRSGKLVGMITTHWRQPHRPSDRDLRLFDVLARQAADLIERSQTEAALRVGEERLRLLAGQLERQVEQRTQELLHTQSRLRELATELTLTEQRERKRLAEELHDHLQQLLVLGKLKLGQGKRLTEIIPECAKIIRETDEVLSEALRYTHTLVAELTPPVLRDQGLAAGLKWLCELMKKKHDMDVTLILPSDEALPLSHDQTVLLFQSVRELLVNAWKHAGTGKATVTMEHQAKILTIEIKDEGKGFDPAAPEMSRELSSKFGLFSIRERMKALGGSFEIESSTGVGTRSILKLPLL